MLTLPKLAVGARVALVCPGCICLKPEHPQLVSDYLQQHYHWQTVFGVETTQALPAAERAEILLNYLLDDSIELIAQIRGGEGTADILPYLHQHAEKIRRAKPKYLLGLSDFTALLVYFDKYYNWPVIHGPSLLQCALNMVDEHTQQLTIDLLTGHDYQPQGLTELVPLNAAARASHSIEAQLTGGNLSVLNISIKDIWEIETRDKILFLEDVGEKAHKIIRTLKYFFRIGLFDQCRAVIFGDFISMPIGCSAEEQQANQQAISKTLTSFAAHHALPVLSTAQIGHGTTNFPLLYSTPYRLQLGATARLELIN